MLLQITLYIHGILTEKNSTKQDVHTQTKKKKKRKRKDRTLNIFLNDLNSKKLDLNIKFSNQEITDIYNAVKKMVNNLTETIGEIDPRLGIGEIISVGSARERTQIIRPCEYDFILTLDVLSKPVTVSITPANQNDASREYMRVKLEDSEITTLLHDITDYNYIRGSRSLPLFRKGLRQLLLSGIHQAVLLRSESSVTESTGTLTFKHTKVEMHGPAFTTRLVWESYEDRSTMDISVDLVPALKLYGILNHVLPSVDNIYAPYITSAKNVGSVLLMPREGQRFKVTFTEAELLLTSRMSGHHRKCYKILKYLVNGEPFPTETRETGLLKYLRYLRDSRTGIHSYSIKITVWDHHYKQKCLEKKDLGSCICDIVRRLHSSIYNRGITHPFNKSRVIDPRYLPSPDGKRKSGVTDRRLRKLYQSLEIVSKLHIQEYNYETCHRAIKSPNSILDQYASFFYAFVVVVTGIILTFAISFGVGQLTKFDIIGLILNIFSVFYVFTIPRYFRRHLVILESRRIKKTYIDILIVLVYSFMCIPDWILYFLSTEKMHTRIISSLLVSLFGTCFLSFKLPAFYECIDQHMNLVLVILFLLSFTLGLIYYSLSISMASTNILNSNDLFRLPFN